MISTYTIPRKRSSMLSRILISRVDNGEVDLPMGGGVVIKLFLSREQLDSTNCYLLNELEEGSVPPVRNFFFFQS